MVALCCPRWHWGVGGGAGPAWGRFGGKESPKWLWARCSNTPMEQFLQSPLFTLLRALTPRSTCSIYCKKCEKPVCCICALLDTQHAGQHCDIGAEIQRRQEELAAAGRELARRRGGFEASRAALQEEAARLEAASGETRELIRQRVEQLVRLVRREEAELLGLVERRREQGRRELAGELRRVEGVLRRMEAGERLVEKMRLYATEQEVMDMQPFVREALRELQRLRPPAAGGRAQHGDFAECRARLQALAERVEAHAGEDVGRPGGGWKRGWRSKPCRRRCSAWVSSLLLRPDGLLLLGRAAGPWMQL